MANMTGFTLAMLAISDYMTETWLLRLRKWRLDTELRAGDKPSPWCCGSWDEHRFHASEKVWR